MSKAIASLFLAVISTIVFASCHNATDSGVITEDIPVVIRPPIKWQIKQSKVPGGKEFRTLYFTDAQTGFAGAAERLYKTTDGGATWKEIVLEFMPNTVVGDIAFFDITNGLMVARTDVSDSPQRSELITTIFGTTDGGETWQTVYSRESIQIHDLKIAGRVAWLIGNGLFRFTDKFEDVSAWKNRYDATNDRAADCHKSAGRILEAAETSVRYISRGGVICRISENGIEAEPNVIPPSPFGHMNFYTGLTADGKIWAIRGSGTRYHGVFSNLSVENEFSSNSPQDSFFISAVHISGPSFVVSGQEVSLVEDKKKGTQSETRTAVIWTTENNGKTWTEIFRKPETKAFGPLQLIKGEKWSVRAINSSGEILSLFEE